MLALKLILVPAFLLLVSLAGKRWGPSVAGWLAGLPVVAGPILFFLAVEQGESFASHAASASLSAVVASMAFSVAYSHAALRCSWTRAAPLALLAWTIVASCLAALAASVWLSLGLSLATLWVVPRLFPTERVRPSARSVGAAELGCRMLAGALLTVAVTFVSSTVGQRWSGLMAVFPVLGMVLAVFSHRKEGPAYVGALLRAMATGMYSFVAFCFALSISITRLGLVGGFAVAVVLSLAVQWVTRKRVTTSPKGLPLAAAQTER